MKARTRNAKRALSRLVLIALLGGVLLAGEMIAVGVAERSWLLITAGSVMLVGLITTTWRSGRAVRNALERLSAHEPSGS